MGKLDRVRRDYVKRRVDVSGEMSDGGDRKVLKWLGHMRCKSDARLIKKVYEFDLEGSRDRGRTCLRRLDGVTKDMLCKVA